MGKKNQSKPDVNGDIDAILEEIEGSRKEEIGKKGKKAKKKKDLEENVTKELEELAMEGDSMTENDKKEKICEDNLATNDDNEDGGGSAVLTKKDEDFEESPDDSSLKKEMLKGLKKEEKKEKGKKGKSKKKKDDDDEDMDQLLAELEMEYSGVPKKEEPNKDARRGSKEENKELGKGEEEKKKNKKEVNEGKLEETQEERDAKDGVKEKKLKSVRKAEGKAEDVDKGKLKSKQAKEVKKDSKEASVEREKEESSKKKKAKTKEEKRKEEEEAKLRKGKPNKKMLAAMKELIEKKKVEEERRRREEEEREREEEERIRKLEELRRIEEERKERLKQKQKDRMKRLKDEGRLLTAKQKLEQRRAQAMLEHLKAQGVAIPEAGEKLAPATYKKPKKKKLDEVTKDDDDEKEEEEKLDAEAINDNEEDSEDEEEDDVIDAWDEISSEGEDEAEKSATSGTKVESIEDAGSKNCEEDDAQMKEEVERHSEAKKRRERVLVRMEQRRLDNEKNRSEQNLRAPVVCVLGHVDHGKTKILDKLRKTNVQEGEVGGITQQIGATNVPFEAIRAQTRMVKDFDPDAIRLPGLLIIDTPGHESFSNLRSRGSSLCDIAILVVDITQGLEPQTIESINLLKAKKTPFIVALNKVDRVFEWDSHLSKDIREIIKVQTEASKNDFERRTKEVIQALNMQGLNAALFWENPDARSYVSLVPTSAISGDGMGNLMSLIISMCQMRLSNKLMLSNELQCSVLEVKTIQGHGTTIDVILINGRLKEGDTIVLAGTEGPIVTQIRSLLIPKPMKEIRVKGQYDELKVVEAALGVKIAARELEKAIAGLSLQVAYYEDEVDIIREEVDREFKAAMRSIKVCDKGVYVQASTLGALEALLEFFKVNKVPYSGIRVGPVVKKDVMRAAAMLEHDSMYAVILAFDVKVERDAQELADKEGVKIFSEETIYHLGDRYVEYIKDYKKKKQDEFRSVAVFPSKLKIIPEAVFNKRDPIVLGVTVEAGILRTGTPLCVPSKEFVEIGVVTSLEFDHKVVEIAKKGMAVCMKVEPVPGQTPKLFGRHFVAEDVLVSKISRESIDACKQYFRDDLGKMEWKLMVELKKQFSIL